MMILGDIRYLLSATRLIIFLKRLLHRLTVRTKRSVMDGEETSKEIRERAFHMCRDSIGGVWAQILKNEFEIKTLSGGLTNYLYLCSLPHHVEVPDNEPREVLFRVYGQIAKSSQLVVQNSVIFALMSEKKLGPKLYGMNPEARLEEYVPARCLYSHELHRPDISCEIARKLAHFHALDMPLCKEPRWLNNMMNSWMTEVMVILKKKGKPKDFQHLQRLRGFLLDQELKSLQEILSKVKSPVVFSHNDLQEGNILYQQSLEHDLRKQLTIIDLEYCSYNFRGHDIGNHFLEWCYDYTVPEPPQFSYKPHNYPTREQQYLFFSAYLQASGKTEITSEDLHDMYVEVNTFALASHFFWGIWSVIQADVADIPFGYMEYAINRLEGYFQMKDSLPNLLGRS